MESTTESAPVWYKIPSVGCESCDIEHQGSIIKREDGKIFAETCSCLTNHKKAKKTGTLLLSTMFSEKMWGEATKEKCLTHIKNFKEIMNEEVQIFLKEHGSIYFYGEMNSGKTLLTMYLARKFLEAGVPTQLYPVGELLRKFKLFNSDISSETYNTCMNIEVLILDDLGTQMSTDFNDSSLFDIINGRYMRGMQTIISGNLNPRDRSKISSDVMERLLNSFLMGRFINIYR